MTSMKIVQFSSRSPPLSSHLQNSSTPLVLDVQLQTKPPPSPNDNQSIKRKYNPRIIRSFLQVGFCFQYQLINLVWLSVDFFSFSWSQSHPHSNFKKLKILFSPSSYNEKTHWSQSWAEVSSTFSWLYILVCSCPITECFIKKSFFSAHFAINLFYLLNLKIALTLNIACEWTRSNQNKKN